MVEYLNRALASLSLFLILVCPHTSNAGVREKGNEVIDFPIEQLPSALQYQGMTPESGLTLQKGDNDYDALKNFLADERHGWKLGEGSSDRFDLRHYHIFDSALASQKIVIDCIDTVGFETPPNTPKYSVEIHYGPTLSQHIFKNTKGPCPLPNGFAASLSEEIPLGLTEFPITQLPKKIDVLEDYFKGPVHKTIKEGDKDYDALKSFLITERDGWMFNSGWYPIEHHDDMGTKHFIYRGDGMEIICVHSIPGMETNFHEVDANYASANGHVLHIAKRLNTACPK